jgi:hypothetical protein
MGFCTEADLLIRNPPIGQPPIRKILIPFKAAPMKLRSNALSLTAPLFINVLEELLLFAQQRLESSASHLLRQKKEPRLFTFHLFTAFCDAPVGGFYRCLFMQTLKPGSCAFQSLNF